MKNFKLTLTNTSIIIPVEEKLIRICFKYYKGIDFVKPIKIFNEVVLETYNDVYYLVEIPSSLFVLLSNVIDEKNSKLLDDLCYKAQFNPDSLDEATKKYFVKHLSCFFFRNEVILSLDKTESVYRLFFFHEGEHNQGQGKLAVLHFNLPTLDSFFDKHEGKNPNIVNELLKYRSLSYTQQEIMDFYSKKEKIKLGLELPSEDDLVHDWIFLHINGEISLIGYIGSLHEELIKIPKRLNNGKKITSIYNYDLDPDKDEFLSLENIKDASKYPDFYKDGVLNIFDSSLFVKIPSVYNGYDETFSRSFTNKLFLSRFN